MAVGLTVMDTVVGRIWGGWLVELYCFLYRKFELYQHLELLPVWSFDFSNKDATKSSWSRLVFKDRRVGSWAACHTFLCETCGWKAEPDQQFWLPSLRVLVSGHWY